ncbi:MAG: hypothetical protein OXU19_17220 [bacterium]|nr:hypothetical protein [bacterium]
MNATQRTRHLLSGKLECGVRGQVRYCCSNHVMTCACTAGRGIRRVEIEERLTAGIKDEPMAPEAAAEAMQGCVEETHRLSRARHASGAADRRGRTAIGKKFRTMIAAIEESGQVRGMSDRLRAVEHPPERGEFVIGQIVRLEAGLAPLQSLVLAPRTERLGMLHHRRQHRQRPVRRSRPRDRQIVEPVAHVLCRHRIDAAITERGQDVPVHAVRVCA